MLLAARQAAASLLPSAGRSALVASLARGLTTAAPAAAAAASHGGESDSDAAPSPASNYILGSNTPVTKRLWERCAAARAATAAAAAAVSVAGRMAVLVECTVGWPFSPPSLPPKPTAPGSGGRWTS